MSNSTLLEEARRAVAKMRPSLGCRWGRDEDGRIVVEPKPSKYMGDMPAVAAVWVSYEAKGGRGKELVKIEVVEKDGEWVVEARRW